MDRRLVTFRCEQRCADVKPELVHPSPGDRDDLVPHDDSCASRWPVGRYARHTERTVADLECEAERAGVAAARHEELDRSEVDACARGRSREPTAQHVDDNADERHAVVQLETEHG